MIIYLIGYMGSGKSKLGKKLAHRIGFDFVDLDLLFEERIGNTIAEYFLEFGEATFRQREQQLLHEILPVSNTVVSTGGGTPCYDDNMDFMNRNGLTIYLKLSVASLASRLRTSTKNRPMLKGVVDDNIDEYIENHLEIRESEYMKAHYVLKGENLTAAMIESELTPILP